MRTVSNRDYEIAKKCVNYIEKIYNRVQKKYEQHLEDHELGFADNSKKMRKDEEELSILNALMTPHKETISCYLAEKREEEENSDEVLKAKWIAENGELPAYMK